MREGPAKIKPRLVEGKRGGEQQIAAFVAILSDHQSKNPSFTFYLFIIYDESSVLSL